MATEVKETIPYDMETFRLKTSAAIDEVKKAIIGKSSLVEDMMIALLSGGNIMLEGAPGVAKTTIAKTFASVLDLDYKRIQFVPDLLPTDITGSYIYNQKHSEFYFKKGPIFTNILLVDEVNRASPKTQSSLLEAMEERQVSVDVSTFPLPSPFMVITTQNPIDVVGTFPMPEAQIDRFMFKLTVGYPSADEELEMLRLKDLNSVITVNKVLVRHEVLNLVDTVSRVHVGDKVIEYIRDLIMASRTHEKLLLGGSPRASISLLKASKAVAAMDGRDYVIPDDIKALAPKVLTHRLIVKPEYELENLTSDEIIDELLNTVKVPE